MTDLNHVVLIGRLTRDLGTDERSFAYTQNGTARANVSIAVNRTRKSGDQWIDEVSYFDVTIWGRTAENLKPYLTKGKQIAVDGYLKQDRWEKDGMKNSKVVVVADSVQLLGGRGEVSFDGGYSQNSGAPRFQPRPQPQGYQSQGADSSYAEPSEGFPEDIPF